MALTCAETARECEEPLAGTAPLATGWMLVEHPGAWGRRILQDGPLDPEVGATIARASTGLGVTTVLIRRPGRRRLEDASARTLLLAHTGAQPWIETLEVHDDRDLLDIDPRWCLSPEPPGLGTAIDTPVLLVCTHARRDRCCASFGRPIADTLAALHPEATWEVSHIGGHRFAGNLLVLPEGYVHGGLGVASAIAVAAQHMAGRLPLGSLRGRTSSPRPAQTAEIALRHLLGLHDLDGVEVLTVDAAGPERHSVGLAAAGGRWRVEVLREELGARIVSCDAADPEEPFGYRAGAIEAVDADT